MFAFPAFCLHNVAGDESKGLFTRCHFDGDFLSLQMGRVKFNINVLYGKKI